MIKKVWFTKIICIIVNRKMVTEFDILNIDSLYLRDYKFIYSHTSIYLPIWLPSTYLFHNKFKSSFFSLSHCPLQSDVAEKWNLIVNVIINKYKEGAKWVSGCMLTSCVNYASLCVFYCYLIFIILFLLQKCLPTSIPWDNFFQTRKTILT